MRSYVSRIIILGLFMLLLVPSIYAYSGTSHSFNVTNLIVDALGIYEENNSEYNVNLGIYDMPIGNDSSITYRVYFGYFGMWPFPSPPPSYPSPEASRAGGGGGFTRGFNEKGDCLKQNGTWVGDELTGYCEYPKGISTIADWFKYWLERIGNLKLEDFRDIKNIGAAISPNNPQIGFVIFGLMLYLSYIMLLIVPKIIKKQLHSISRLPFIIRLGLFAIFGLSIFIMVLYIINIDAILEPLSIGQRIAPSNKFLGFILFFLSLYLLFKVFPTLFKYFVGYKLKQNSLKKEAIDSIPQMSFGFGSEKQKKPNILIPRKSVPIRNILGKKTMRED